MDNILGLFAFLAYIGTLLPGNLRAVFPAFKHTDFIKILAKNRRTVGILTFVLSVAHACAAIYQHNSDLSEVVFYLESISGLSTLLIFTLLTVTSNTWSMRKLKENWKRMHSLTYIAVFLIPWHIFVKMLDGWTIITVICLILSADIVRLWLFRKYLDLPK